MKMLLDTNVVSATRKPRRNPEIVDWLRRQPAHLLHIPGPVLAEFEYGVSRVADPVDRAKLRLWLELIVQTYQITGMPADAFALFGEMLACRALSSLWAGQSGSRRPKWAADLQIAAIAITRDAALATLNANDFDRIRAHFPKLRTVDPRTGEPISLTEDGGRDRD